MDKYIMQMPLQRQGTDFFSFFLLSLDGWTHKFEIVM